MIKTILLFFLSLCFYLTASAQAYHPMVREGRQWDELHSAPELCWADYGRRFYFEGDVVSGGFTWKQLWWYNVVAESGWFCPPYSVDTNATFSDNILIREDTVTRQVFILYPGGTASLLYDFSLAVGDTFISAFTTQGDPFIVTGISDFTLMNGEVVQEFTFSPEGSYMESIGSYQGMYGPLFLLEYPMQPRCVSQDGIQLTGSACYSILSAPDPEPGISVSVSPNPADDFLRVQLSGAGPVDFLLMDPTGRVVRESHAITADVHVEVGDLSPGIYIYRVSGQEGCSGGNVVILR